MLLSILLACAPKTPPEPLVEAPLASPEPVIETIEVEDLRTLEARVAAHPEDAEAWLAMAWLHQREGRPELAELCLERAKVLPTAALLNEQGLAELRGGDSVSATRSFQRALEVDPAHRDAGLNLGALALQYGDYGDAQSHFEAVLRAHPEDVDAQRGLQVAQTAQERAKPEAPAGVLGQAGLKRKQAELIRLAEQLEARPECEPMVAAHLREVAERGDLDEVNVTLEPGEQALMSLACP